MKTIIAVTFFLIGFGLFANAQSSIKDTPLAATIISAHYGYYFPVADMAKRFGNNSAIGGSLHRKMANNYFVGLNGDFIFGRKVYDDAFLDSLSNNDDLIGYTGTIAEVALYERGFTAYADCGKLLNLKTLNPNSGILVSAGVGFMQHKIRIVDLDEVLLQLDKEYQKGYDRLTNGLMLTQSVQFLNLDAHHRINFKVGLDLKQAFTRNRRSWNFDEHKQDNTLRFDMLIGLKGSWMLPLYSKHEERFYSF